MSGQGHQKPACLAEIRIEMRLQEIGWTSENFVGDALCLDFCNTLSGRTHGRLKDRLADYDALLSWSLAADVIDRETAIELSHATSANREKAGRAHSQAIRLREAIFKIFYDILAGRTPSVPDVDRLNQIVAQTAASRRLIPYEQRFRWNWQIDSWAMEGILGPIAQSASDLLLSTNIERVRMCDGEACAWLFVDRTKSRTRRWCDMAVCGNREKSRRSYRSKRSGE